MEIDVRKTLLEPVAVLSRVGDDAFKATQLEGCWREMPSRLVDNSGNESGSFSVRVQVPDLGRFSESGEDLADGEWTLSKGDYVLRGTLPDGTPGTLTAKQAIALVRRMGGVSVKAWRDCRRPVSVPGTCGAFASMVHMEG